ncbi:MULTISPECIES: helix-turn-helix domain-containing protein [unclassified Streptomyces]|uniref:helix-turn-helix domain-containing protein n=1 Tax=unclassified Streptomyces TaxID=2593676 RepID=UPI0035D83AE2
MNLARAAEYLGISPNTLYVWRHRRQGQPAGVKAAEPWPGRHGHVAGAGSTVDSP